jgi:capsule polysaccharide export protein KpsE/RkpR
MTRQQVPGSGRSSDPTDAPLAPATSTVRLVRELVRTHRPLLFALPSGLTALAALVVLAIPRLWRSESSFMVERSANGPLPASVMGMLGQLAGASEGDSPQFYAELLVSPPVLDSLLASTPRSSCGPADSGTVIDRLNPAGHTPAERSFYGRRILEKRIKTGISLRTGVVEVGIEARCPQLANEMLTSLLAQVNAFNVTRRQSRVRQRREFVQAQLAEAEGRLRVAESELSGFLDRNRRAESPQLRFEQERLQRKVDMQAEVTSTLRREFEMARIEEINGTPALTVVTPPSIPVEASYPKRRLLVALTGVAAIVFTLIAVLARTLLLPLPPEASALLRAVVRRARARAGLSVGPVEPIISMPAAPERAFPSYRA